MDTSDPILREAVQRIVDRFRPRRVVLFGSRAWGKPRKDSDYDLLILLDEAPDPRRLAGQIRWALVDLPASFDILVRPVAWWQTWCETPFTLERHIEHEGLRLHAA